MHHEEVYGKKGAKNVELQGGIHREGNRTRTENVVRAVERGQVTTM